MPKIALEVDGYGDHLQGWWLSCQIFQLERPILVKPKNDPNKCVFLEHHQMAVSTDHTDHIIPYTL